MHPHLTLISFSPTTRGAKNRNRFAIEKLSFLKMLQIIMATYLRAHRDNMRRTKIARRA
jgi:hypothetical protein